MKKFYLYSIVLFLPFFVSCQQHEPVEDSNSLMSFFATGEIGTRTVLNGDLWYPQVLWSPSDEINIFCQNGGGKFVSKNTETTGGTVEFVGSLSNVKDRKTEDLYWAVYPYSEDRFFDGSSVGVSLPSEQNAVAGNVQEGLLVSMARSGDSNLYFYNLCGLIGIGVHDSGITRIVFRGNNAEPLAGDVVASFDDEGLPYVSSFKNASQEIVLIPPSGDVFEPGQVYYVVCFPGAFEKGYTIEMYREELYSIKKIDTPVSLGRARIVNLSEPYTGGIISSRKYNGKEYTLRYKVTQGGPQKVRYWITVDDKVIDIPEDFECYSDLMSQSPTKIGPALAVDTEREILYFARLKENWRGDLIDGVLYTISPSETRCKSLLVGYYPYFCMDYGQNRPVLYSFSSLSDDQSCDQFISYLEYTDEWVPIEDWRPRSEYLSSGYSTKNLSDIIFLFQNTGQVPSPMDAVDLGLSIKWATHNMGASTPECFGYYYSWGELSPKKYYSLDNYRFYEGEGTTDSYGRYEAKLTKYSKEDNKYSLEAEDDVATAQLGENWRIPSLDEWLELTANCSWDWTVRNGVGGYQVTGPNGNSIFLPAAGLRAGGSLFMGRYDGVAGHYLTSENAHDWYNQYTGRYDDFVQAVFCNFSEYDGYTFWCGDRWDGYTIRPVTDIPVEELKLDQTEIEIAPGQTVFLDLTIIPENATKKSVVWSSSDETVASVSPDGEVHGLREGSAIITVTSESGKIQTSCRVMVRILHVTEIYFALSEMGVFIGDPRRITPVILPEDASDQSVSWSSSNNSIATVSSSGEVTGVSEGKAVITATTVDGGYSASCTVFVFRAPSLEDSPEYVDMGLSVKWASRNLGATMPEEYGDYFAWGETEPKDVYTWETYKWCAGSEYTLTKYCGISSYGYNGFVDYKTQLDDEDDAAKVRLGGKWRMPTIEEMVDLVDYCVAVPSVVNGVGGCYLVSKNTRNAIFIPASGVIPGDRASFGISNLGVASYYLSKSTTSRYVPYCLFVSSSEVSKYIATSRQEGHTIRPVYADDSGNEGITPGGDINM